MSGLRPIVLGITTLLIAGLIGTALYHTVSGDPKEPLTLASSAPICSKDPENPQRVVLPEGSTVMDFTLPSYGGKPVTLSKELAKRPVLLELFASWCPHCQHSAPALEALYKEHKNDLTILSINAGDTPDKPSTTKQFKKDYKIAYTILEKPTEALMNGYCLQGFPSFFLINQQGKVVWRFAGTLKAENLENLKKALDGLQ
ncbi:MAG: TlpA disulfide reductase family protein [Vampirovibrionales bacterium]|nr:TlpA disulfide reductase family protein [Vampirovibrionales bacterium]